MLRAGVEIKLKPGWKTYWRYPGDSGVPPVFDFAASENVKAVTVLYPAPMRFADGGGGHSIGYKGDVILPLHVVPQDAGKPVTLRLKLDYAVCEKLCVPAKAEPSFALSGDDSAQRPRSARPRRACRSRASEVAGRSRSAPSRRDAGPGKPRIVVDVAAPAGAGRGPVRRRPDAGLGAAAA